MFDKEPSFLLNRQHLYTQEKEEFMWSYKF